MIYTNVTVKINNNGTATSNNKVVLYRGDREVEIQITISGNPFVVENSTYAQLLIRRPDATPIFSGIAPLQDSKVILTITEENIDELIETGPYAYQIRLYDEEMNSRVTLPPVENGLEIREPIADETSGVIGRAMIGYSLISRARAVDESQTFIDEEYNRTNWVDGDFITDVRMNKIEDALYTINQKTVENSTSAYITSDMASTQLVEIGDSLYITFDFTSTNVGRGTLKVHVNSVEKFTMYVEQEETTVEIPAEYFTKGDNIVTLQVKDRNGKSSNDLTFYVRYGGTELFSDFDSHTSYRQGATVRYYFTPSALDTNQELTFYMVIDGVTSEGASCTSDVRGYYTFPNNLSIGAHRCEAYIIDESNNKSNSLYFNLVIINNTSIVVASDVINPVAEEGDQLVLDYQVYSVYDSSFIVKTYIDNDLVNTGTCGLETSYFRTSSLTEGNHTIKIEAWNLSETTHGDITWNVTITEGTFARFTPVTSGALFIGSATNRSNSDANRDKLVGIDQDGNEITANLTNFSFNSNSGWVNDELIFNGIASAEIPIAPLADNARYGFTLDIEFTSREIGEEGALVLELWDDNKDCGIKITTEELILRSAEGNECRLYFEDNANTSAMFIIDRNEAKAKIYINGVMCSAFHLTDYTSGGQYFLEDFSVSSNIKLGGKGYCKLRNLRVYEVALTTNEILNNFIANKITRDEQIELSDFQEGDSLPTLTVYCDFSGLGKDDKKPCRITYTSTDETKYGPSFTLDHRQSTVQYQGTSSMAYPIKNYRLNLRDENGDKLYYEFPFGKPECRFTLKADFMSSGHWQNTGLTKWINDNLYNYNEKDEKSMNPKKWFDLQNGGNIDDTRECIYGFPCRLILVNDGNTPLAVGQNEPAPGNSKDMGIFNFNNDKDNVNTMGLDSENFPDCMSFEVTANSDTSAGAFMSYVPEPIGLKGGNYYNTSFIDWARLGLKAGDTITITSDATIYNVYILPTAAWENSVNTTVNKKSYSTKLQSTFPFLNIEWRKQHKPSYIIINDIKYAFVEADAITTYGEGFKSELDYLKESFEIRHPSDPKYDWYGYLGINAGTMVTDYCVVAGQYSTTFWDWTDPTMTLISDARIKTVECYNYNILLAPISVNGTQGTVSLISGTNRVRLIFETAPKVFYVNDTKYLFGDQLEILDLKNPYLGSEMNPDYGLKRLIEWVDKSTDEEFVRDFENYFNKDYTLRYYLLVITLGMVDNLGKNMMLDSWDGLIWYPRFYDCDTICSYDNSGDIKFDVDIEMEQGYWNTSSSRLWTRIRDLMHPDLVAKYNDMRQNGLAYEILMSYFYGEQISKIPQKYYNMDYDVKYAPFADGYISMAHGDGYEHLKRWLKNRIIFTDSLFDYAPGYTNDMLTIRANTLDLMTINIETYTPVYQHVSWFNGQMDKKKIDTGESVSFSGHAMTETDQEVLIYGGSNVKRITGISSMNPNQMLIGGATRLVELDASNSPLLADINANKANLLPHTFLNSVNLSNCPLLTGNLRLDNSPLIRNLDMDNTPITGLYLPDSIKNLRSLELANTNVPNVTLRDNALLTTLALPGSIRELVLKDLPALNSLTCVDYTNLRVLNTENVKLDYATILARATNLESIRMINIDCQLAIVPMQKIMGLNGLDANGQIVPIGQAVSGKITLSSCTTSLETQLKAMFPLVTFTILGYVQGCTAKFYDGDGKLLYTDEVVQGGMATYAGPTPTKASTAQYHYKFIGWNVALGPINGNTIIRAEFESILRYYTVKFLYPSTDELIDSQYLAYGTTPTKPVVPGDYDGWTPNVTSVTGDATYYAVPIPMPEDMSIFEFTEIIEDEVVVGYDCKVLASTAVPAKLVFPSRYNNLPVISISGTHKTSRYHTVTSVVVPASIKKMGDYTFENYAYLASINTTFIENLESIGKYSFNGCQRLTQELNFKNLKTIDDYGFYGLGYNRYYPKTVNIQNVTSMGISVFSSGVYGTITWPDAIHEVPDYTFESSSIVKGLTNFNHVTEIKQYGFNSTDLSSFYPSNKTVFDSITSIGTYAFNNATLYTTSNKAEVVFPNVTYIESGNAFGYIKNVKSLRFPKYTELTSPYIYSVNTTGTSSTNDCLMYVIYGSKEHPVTSIATSSIIVNSSSYNNFKTTIFITENGEVDDITLSAGGSITGGVGNGSFICCSDSIEISVDPDSSYIYYMKIDNEYAICLGSWMPNSSSNVKTYTVKSTIDDVPVTKIAYNAWRGSTYLSSIILPNSIEDICGYAFYGCTGLTNVNRSDNGLSIGTNAFYNCKVLANIGDVSTIRSIGSSALYSCEALTGPFVNEYITTASATSFTAAGFTSIKLPNVTEVQGGAFKSMPNVTEIELPKATTVKGAGVFYNCPVLKSVKLYSLSNGFSFSSAYPSYYDAYFSKCTSLEYVWIGSAETPVTSYSGTKSFSSYSGLELGHFNQCPNLKMVNFVTANGRLSDIDFDRKTNVYYSKEESLAVCTTSPVTITNDNYTDESGNTYILTDQLAILTSVPSDTTNISISTVNGVPLKKIGAPLNDTVAPNLTTVDLPNVTGICAYCFGNGSTKNATLTSINIPKVDFIPTGALSYLQNVPSIDLPEVTRVNSGGITAGPQTIYFSNKCKQLYGNLSYSAKITYYFGSVGNPVTDTSGWGTTIFSIFNSSVSPKVTIYTATGTNTGLVGAPWGKTYGSITYLQA